MGVRPAADWCPMVARTRTGPTPYRSARPLLIPSLHRPPRPRPSGGRKPALFGAALVVASVTFFIAGLPTEQTTFSYDMPAFVERWNTRAAAAGRPTLFISDPVDTLTGGGAVIEYRWSSTMRLRARTEKAGDRLVEVSVMGSPDLDDPAFLAAAIDLLVAATEPDLAGDGRRAVLQELGIVGGSDADLRATSGGTDYVSAAAEGGLVGVGAAPRSTFANPDRDG